MAVNDIYKLTVQGKVLGQDHVHTLHMRQAVVTSVNDPQTIIDEWQANCRTEYRTLFGQDHTPVEVLSCRKVCGATPLPAGVEEIEAAANRAGLGGAPGTQFLPPYAAAVTSIRTALAGKSYRGRSYIGGVAEGIQTNGVADAAYVTILEDYYQAVFDQFDGAGITGSSYKWFVFSRTLAAGPGNCQDFGNDVTGFIVRTNLGTMRSRAYGHGN